MFNLLLHLSFELVIHIFVIESALNLIKFLILNWGDKLEQFGVENSICWTKLICFVGVLQCNSVNSLPYIIPLKMHKMKGRVMVYWGFLTWKELKKRSMKSFVRRRGRAPCEVDSSVTNENRTEWIPSNGIRVRVDLASLKKREKTHRSSGNKHTIYCANALWDRSLKNANSVITYSPTYCSKPNPHGFLSVVLKKVLNVLYKDSY